MSTPPARCCAPATKGRCSNAPAPYGQSRYIGTVEIAACNHPKHQVALRSLPDFQRRAGVCGADDCGKPAESGLCPEHRQLYQRHGINIRALLAQEAPMTEPTPLSKLPELGFARIQVQTTGAALSDLEAAVTKVTPPAAPKAWPATPESDVIAACALEWPVSALMVRQPNGLRYSVPSPVGASAGIGPGLNGILEQVRNGRLSWESAVSADNGLTWSTITSPEHAAAWLLAEHKRLYTIPEVPHVAVAPPPPVESQDAADGGATFADILDALDVHTAPESAQTGRTNLCGGTGEQMDPLAYDGWSDKPCPGCDGCRDAEPPPVDVLTEEEFVRAFEARMQQVGEQEESDGEPSEGDIQDAYSGRWGQYTVGVDPATGKEHTAAYVVELVHPSDHQTTAALPSAILGPRQDTPTLADVQAELARERERAIAAERTAHGAQGEVRRGREAVARLEKLLAGAEERADRAELDAVQERARADEALEELATIAAMLDPEDSPAFDSDDQPIPLPVRVQTALMPDTAYERELRKSLHAVEAELYAVDRALQHLGAYGNGPTIDQLLKVLTPEDRRNILELQAAEARLDLARLKASRLNPPPPEKLAEYAAKVAEVEARIAALDAGEVQG